MALTNRAGLVGSAAGSVILTMLLLRPIVPNPASQAAPESTQKPRAAVQRDQSELSKPGKKNWLEEGPWKASRQHFAGLQPEDQCPSLEAEAAAWNLASLRVTVSLRKTAQAQGFDDPRSQVWCIPRKTTVRAMIGIVPDPVHSHLSLIFDRSLEALQSAGAATQYVMDRYWLPWQLETSEDSAKNEEQPGLLLFRRDTPPDLLQDGSPDPDTPAALYVFLVSDTSTAGINGTQFRNAVHYLLQVCGTPAKPAGRCGHDNRIWIMGPTFSGSLGSLRALTDSLGDPGSEKLEFTAYSGTVSSICAIQAYGLFSQAALLDELSPDCIKHDAPAHLAPHLHFRSLVGDVETMLSKLLAALRAKGDIQCGNATEVAVLSETGTTYGGSVSLPQAHTPDPDSEDIKTCGYTSFLFPREISSLRNASAASQPLAGSPQTGALQGSSYLPFTLADRQPNASDQPLDFSRAQGPLSKEAVLMEYAAELRRGHYKYVGIAATNVVDSLFIAGFLRRACPNIRLFMLSPDLLFERDLDNVPYIGTVSITTYPLISRNLDWTNLRPGDANPDGLPPARLRRLPFADQYQQGQYNAALLVMQAVIRAKQDKPPLREANNPFIAAHGDFNPESSVLPVWITVVGTGGYWPIQVIPSKPLRPADRADQPSVPAKMYNQDFSPGWRGAASLLASLAFLQTWILFTVKPTSLYLRDFALINAAPGQRFFFINLASASLAFTMAVLCTPAWKFGWESGFFVVAIAIAVSLAILALLSSSLYVGFVFARIRHSEDKPELRTSYISPFFSVAVWLFAALGEWCWWDLHHDDSSHYGFFFGYRAANLATGVSPLLPMLLLLTAIFLWSIFETWRLRFDDDVRPRLDSRDYFVGKVTEPAIAGSINKYCLRTNYVVAFILVFGVWFCTLPPGHPFVLFEKYTFGVLYELLFCLVVALMLACGLRLGQTWSDLRRLLNELARSRLRHSFSRIKRQGWSPIWQSGGQEEEWINMTLSFEVMEQIKNCDSQPQLVNNISSALEKREEIRKKVQSANRIDDAIASFRNLQRLFQEIQGSLANVLNDVIGILDTAWRKQSLEMAESDETDKEDKPVVVNCPPERPDPELKRVHRLEEYAALRYVTFIRAVLTHIRHWLILQAIVFSLLLISLNVYSFEPHRSLIWSLTAIFVIIGAIAIQVLVQVHRDPIISRISGTKPNKLGLEFFVRLATLGAFPLLTLLATHFPSIGRYLLSFFQPGLEALK